MPRGPFAAAIDERWPPRLDRLVFQEAPQVVGQVLGRGVAAGRVFGHRLEDDGFQVVGDRRVDAARERAARRR